MRRARTEKIDSKLELFLYQFPGFSFNSSIRRARKRRSGSCGARASAFSNEARASAIRPNLRAHIRTGRVREVIVREFSRASKSLIRASPCSGPSHMATATARFSSTTAIWRERRTSGQRTATSIPIKDAKRRSATVHRRRLELPREICPVSLRRLRVERQSDRRAEVSKGCSRSRRRRS